MAEIQQLMLELTNYALSKKGAVDTGMTIEVPQASWGDFFEVREIKCFAHLPVLAKSLKNHRAMYPVIRKSHYGSRDGHIYMEVPLDAEIPVEFLKSLIDDAHAIVWNKLDDVGRLEIELAGLPYDESMILDQLVEGHGLTAQSKVIRTLARPAILLRTKRCSEVKIPLGASKIGGKPDLPSVTPWPLFTDGTPLAFLAQLNLAAISEVGSPIKGLPSSGILSLFSVWGWVDEDGVDCQVPEGNWDEQSGWTVVLHTPLEAPVERRLRAE